MPPGLLPCPRGAADAARPPAPTSPGSAAQRGVPGAGRPAPSRRCPLPSSAGGGRAPARPGVSAARRESESENSASAGGGGRRGDCRRSPDAPGGSSGVIVSRPSVCLREVESRAGLRGLPGRRRGLLGLLCGRGRVRAAERVVPRARHPQHRPDPPASARPSVIPPVGTGAPGRGAAPRGSPESGLSRRCLRCRPPG